MKNNFYLLIILMCFNLNCKTKATQIENNSHFDLKHQDKIFKTLDDQNKWVYIIEATQKNFKNPATFEKWAVNQVQQLIQLNRDPSNETLYDLNYNSAKKFYTNLSFVLANYSISNQNITVETKNLPIVYCNLSNYYYTKKNKDSLGKYLPLFEKYIHSDLNNYLELNLYVLKSNLADLNGDYYEEAIYLHKAIENTKKDDLKNLSSLYLNLSNLYLTMDYVEKAKIYLDSSIKILGIKNFDKNLLNTIGIIQAKNNQFVKANQTYQYAIDYALENENMGLLAQTYSNLGNLKRKEKKFNEALNFMNISDSICRLIQLNFGVIINSINRAETYYDMKNYNQAIAQIKSLNTFTEDLNNNPKINKEFYAVAYKIYDITGDLAKANLYYRKYMELKTELQGDSPRSLIAEWELLKEQEKNLRKITESENLKNRYLFITIICLVILFFIMIFYFNKRKNHLNLQSELLLKNQKMNYQLELKSKELLTESIQSISIQNTKKQILEELDEILKQLPDTHQRKFLSLKRKLNYHTDTQFLNEFETRFNGVYESFYERIKQIAPELTTNELRICALMRLQISTKEIASLTNRTIGTIDNTRSQIRKKLKLEDSDNLQEYLTSI
jgi:tetratricopeptide (TPR) repeat protein